jgi:hypothetical protein
VLEALLLLAQYLQAFPADLLDPVGGSPDPPDGGQDDDADAETNPHQEHRHPLQNHLPNLLRHHERRFVPS